MRFRAALLFAGLAGQAMCLAPVLAPVHAPFVATTAVAANACPYIEPHDAAIERARALRAERAATRDIATLCRILPQLAAAQEEMASYLEQGAAHPNCRVQTNGGASPAELRRFAQENRQTAAQCGDALAAQNGQTVQRSSGGCGSDITGTKGGRPAAARNCDTARQMRKEARTAAKSSPAVAKGLYREAADEYIAAGDLQLAAVVLRELAALDAGAAGGQSGPAPAAAGGAPPSGPFKLWLPTKDNPDCGSATSVDKMTAAYYNTCVDPEPPKAVKRYQHPITPQDLLAVARDRCGSASHENYQCFVDAKVKYLLANDPVIRSRCQIDGAAPRGSLRDELTAKLGMTIDYEARKKDAIVTCVDEMYLYGPDGPPSFRDELKRRLQRAGVGAPPTSDYRPREAPAAAAHCRPGAGWAPYSCCQNGFGMKPTPGGFGSWSCQKLGTFSSVSADDPAEGEREIDAVATLAMLAADRNLAGQVDDATREKCATSVFASVRSVMKGGMPIVPAYCQALADAARAELAYYAGRHITHDSDGLEELLAYLPRGGLGPPQPGVQDMTPDERMLRQAECMARGGQAENCAAAVAPPPSGGQSAPPPSLAGAFIRGGISP
ncbi:MAG: hypothetical protein KIT48_20300 [Pseudolabrys sp.]|nr:hypothetical protein [Pseudolabrys sp.]